MTDREFARVPLRAPTIYLALPLICAHWAILRRWAEPHYLASYGLMPARHGGSLYPRDSAELEVCAFFFDQAYLDRSDARKTVRLLRSRHPFKNRQ